MICVAEGAGQDLLGGADSGATDASGNPILKDIGLYLKDVLKTRLKVRSHHSATYHATRQCVDACMRACLLHICLGVVFHAFLFVLAAVLMPPCFCCCGVDTRSIWLHTSTCTLMHMPATC